MSFLHFDLEGFVFPVSVLYPFLVETVTDEAAYIECRRRLHRRFLQKEDRPAFLSSFSQEGASLRAPIATTMPINIHERLPSRSSQI